jgi:DNA glycosylase AlkZ-like
MECSRPALAAISMTTTDLVRFRLSNQRLVGRPCSTPARVVEHLGAVQAQDYGGAKWAIAQRTGGVTDADVEGALCAGVVLRTHVLRPTWHIVPAADIRWMLELTAPRVRALMAHYDRRLGLDDALYNRSNRVMEKALRDGKFLTRAEAGAVLVRAGIDPGGSQRLGHLLMRAELDGVVCSGPRQGKQATYALLAERAPKAKALPREEALATLATRYFTSHGPATVKDFAWWSGLTVADASRAVESAHETLRHDLVDGVRYWSGAVGPGKTRASGAVHLLPNFDEYHVAYKDRAMLSAGTGTGTGRVPGLGDNVLAIDGRLLGTWKRTVGPKGVAVRVSTVRRLKKTERDAVADQVKRYGEFLGLPAFLAL